ncbi:uncharacterized protein EAE97_010077 [Botrytis byssoidea]|uniref:Uncharacterized protein n=1 Tax=Botrytis byssoidea TaxID=139641 RepID=A0A9P5I4Z1_9HELO|nr:uncharacterized protein EAE97_010077 [Botrytis byssoidea]KAF7927402.1 hypothetical protein EAE97_010077 [Botrytis byssoidea]
MCSGYKRVTNCTTHQRGNRKSEDREYKNNHWEELNVGIIARRIAHTHLPLSAINPETNHPSFATLHPSGAYWPDLHFHQKNFDRKSYKPLKFIADFYCPTFDFH